MHRFTSKYTRRILIIMSASPTTQLDPALLLLHSEWHSLLMSMHGFLLSAKVDDVRDFAVDMKSTHDRRMIDFNNQSVRLNDKDISRADMMFVLQCYSICCRVPHVRKMAILTDVREISAKLCVLGCRHTTNTRNQPIDEQSITSLLYTTASWIVQFGSIPSSTLTETLTLVGHAKVALSPQTGEQLHNVMSMPHLNHLRSSTEKDQITDTIRRAEDEQSPLSVFALPPQDEEMNVEVSQEEDMEQSSQMGSYWLNDTQIAVVGLIPLASRVFHQISLEQHVMNLYPISQSIDPYVYPPVALANLHALVATRCATTAGDTFVPTFREAVHKYCLPMGSLSMRYRTVVTHFQQTACASLMERELGMDTTQALYNLLNVPLTDIASNAKHELHELLVFFTLGQLIENRCGVDFSSLVVMSCDLLTKHAILGVNVEAHEARRPRIVCIMQRVWLHEQGQWYKCDGLVDAALKLLMVMKTGWKHDDATKKVRYNNTYKGKCMASVCDAIIGTGLHVQLMPWRNRSE